MADLLELLLVMVAIGSPVFIVVFIVQYFRYRAETGARLAALKHQIDAQATRALEEEVARLRERMQVLEAIVADSSYELRQSFKSIQA